MSLSLLAWDYEKNKSIKEREKKTTEPSQQFLAARQHCLWLSWVSWHSFSLRQWKSKSLFVIYSDVQGLGFLYSASMIGTSCWNPRGKDWSTGMSFLWDPAHVFLPRWCFPCPPTIQALSGFILLGVIHLAMHSMEMCPPLNIHEIRPVFPLTLLGLT